MENVGISPEEFVNIIKESGDLVKNWPFGHMTEPWSKRRTSTTRGIIVPGAVPELLVSGENTQYPEQVPLVLKDSEQANYWNEMAGINVTFVGKKDEHGFEVSKVLGVEQPLDPYEGLDSGFVHGIVLDQTEPGFYRINLGLGVLSQKSILMCSNVPPYIHHIHHSGPLHSLRQGEPVRARAVKMRRSPGNFKLANDVGPLYLLNKPPRHED